jgi:hypothetical protein
MTAKAARPLRRYLMARVRAAFATPQATPPSGTQPSRRIISSAREIAGSAQVSITSQFESDMPSHAVRFEPEKREVIPEVFGAACRFGNRGQQLARAGM